MYKCLAKNQFKDADGYELVPLREGDIESIRLWRNEQIEILRQKVKITAEEQKRYFQEVIVPTFEVEKPPQILFSFLHNDRCIGYGGLTHLDWENARAEVSFIVATAHTANDALYEKEFTHFLRLLFLVAFEVLSLHRLYTETFAFRKSHMAILEKNGFKSEGTLREHVNKKGSWHDSILHGLLKGEWSHAG